jgi:ubiquinone/menaquinone biosynthesis C-methylase UbiE
MSGQTIRFQDGEAYDRGMGRWSRLAADIFLDWVAPDPGLRWIDIGCGSGAFTEAVVQRHAPTEIVGVDPSEAQIAFARTRPTTTAATFESGDAQALRFEADRFDAAAMALVIFFVPDPAKGVAEMARVVRPGGIVATYAWDMAGGGFPFHPIQAELRAMGITPPLPPTVGASDLGVMRELWTNAGLEMIETRVIEVTRTFTDFDDLWVSSTITGSIGPTVAGMTPDALSALRERVRSRLPAPAADGSISYQSRANAIKGRVPR